MEELGSLPPQAEARPRHRPLARTFSRARWPEYRDLLSHALELGYRIVSLERFVTDPRDRAQPLLVLRHDVDQHPRSALKMAAIERALGTRSTWYFRWRTADPRVIRHLRADGFEVGLHYETLTRRLLERGPRPIDEALLDSCRAELRGEIESFARQFGAIRSICPHGDTRVPGVRNGLLLRGQSLTGFDGVFDCNESMHGRALGAWLTDRSAPRGGWGGGADPLALLDGRTTPILCVTHPNNWAAGLSLWLDRAAAASLPDRFLAMPIRTRSDLPSR